MIAGFRKSFRSMATVALLFIALVAIVVTGFGTDGLGGIGSLGGSGSGSGAVRLASVDGKAIEASEVSDVVNRSFNQARAQQPTLDMATFLGQGAYEETLKQMIVAEAIRNYAAARGLTASDRMIDREIVNIPAFRNFSGQFDQNAFQGALARERITEARLRDDIAGSLIQRQLLGPIALGMRVPEGVAREYASLLLERRRGTIGVVPAAAMAQGINPTDAQLASFYQRNRAAFTTPERRVIKYALIGPDQVARTAAATEAEIAQVYRGNATVYGPRETRTLQAIVLPSEAAARAFAQRVRGGTSFTDAASQAGFSAGDINFADQRRDQFASATAPQVAAAAFGAAQGALAGPVRSALGYHVVRVERISNVPARPLAAVRGDIARAIEQRKRTEALAALVARIEEQLADGASFEEIARGAGLAVVTTPPVTAQGQPAAGGPAGWAAPPELAALLTGAFDMDAEEPEPVIEALPDNVRFALLGVERVEPAAPPPLARIRDQVRAAFVERAASQRARALADRIAARINAGTPV
ncbi:MAG TPA: SurA N-terminal domain-containing protein, partial [Allosphingosinicella sp.]|nr:SurA N-terminal domain-containing protein [Allosphingosinicella sp.]